MEKKLALANALCADFYLAMKDHWTAEDWNKNAKLNREIKALIADIGENPFKGMDIYEINNWKKENVK